MTRDIQGSKRIAKATYDFSTAGGAVGAIILPDADVLPSGAIVTDVKAVVRTTVTSGGAATIALTAGGVTLKAAETIANSVYNGTGIVDVIRAGNGGSTGTAKYVPISATSSAAIGITVATAALTAGVVDFYVEYLVP
jgi:hypothetical protein